MSSDTNANHDGLEDAGHEILNFMEGKPFFSRPGGKIFIIWIVLTVIGVLIGFYAPHHLFPAFLSSQGSDVFKTMVLFTVLAAPVAALVYAVGIYSLIAWRHKGDQSTPPPDGPPQRGDGPVTVLWLGVSALLVVVLLAWGITVWSSQQVTQSNALVVKVTGQQWVWNFQYPGTNVSSHTLMLPVNRPVVFDITSEDVTHGFWPVNLGVQVDANPNTVTVIQATPNRLGHFTVRCSQLCGLMHAFMYSPGAVVTSKQFGQWLVTQGASASSASTVAQVKLPASTSETSAMGASSQVPSA